MPAPDEHALTWSDVLAREPRLEALAEDVASIEVGPRFCANAVWVHTYRPRLKALAGGEEQVPALGNLYDLVADARGRGALAEPAAYDVAYDALYTLLPDCQDCSCLPRGWLHAA